MTSATLTGQGDAVRLAGYQMTASAFPMLGVPPLLGRRSSRAKRRPAPMPSSS